MTATVRSIQSTPKRSYKTHTARLNQKTKEHAYKAGTPWTDDDVEVLARMIDKDETTYEMAIALNRTYYGTQYARSHVGFALRHVQVFTKILNPKAGKK